MLQPITQEPNHGECNALAGSRLPLRRAADGGRSGGVSGLPAEAAFQQVPLVRRLGDMEANRRYEQAVARITFWQRAVAGLSARLEVAKRGE